VVRSNYSQAAQVAAVKEGRTDLAWDQPLPGTVPALSQSFPSQLHQDTRPETTYLWLNVRAPPFNNMLARAGAPPRSRECLLRR
jgi:hypothetical protein